jgi:hypothetical protein
MSTFIRAGRITQLRVMRIAASAFKRRLGHGMSGCWPLPTCFPDWPGQAAFFCWVPSRRFCSPDTARAWREAPRQWPPWRARSDARPSAGGSGAGDNGTGRRPNQETKQTVGDDSVKESDCPLSFAVSRIISP